MPPAIKVDAEALRSVSQRLSRLPSTIQNVPNQVEQETKQAANANRGFLSADAAEAFADCALNAAKALATHVGAMAPPIAESAQAWDDADGEAKSKISKFDGDVGEAGSKVAAIQVQKA
ncbi:type VII secretion target [Glycomyces buryatensis]|uniref:3-deoxy-7-phosphoheptulonate synthase n=1 Tax=Glycomyces buryatensis TaxID=2570927 RepID=A0A4V4HSV0_9ACTN|nr:type VII secretion target [Glycomyces buryatensis]THV42986.1 3-deoxy-7-phosphoheptulonate synthase [Glycomyces buryatensis]